MVSGGLFSEKRLAVLRNADSLGVKKEREVEQFLDKQKLNICDVIVLSDGIKKTPIFSNLKPVIESYMLPKFYFAFLDALVPGNAKTALDLFSKIPEDCGSLRQLSLLRIRHALHFWACRHGKLEKCVLKLRNGIRKGSFIFITRFS